MKINYPGIKEEKNEKFLLDMPAGTIFTHPDYGNNAFYMKISPNTAVYGQINHAFTKHVLVLNLKHKIIGAISDTNKFTEYKSELTIGL